MNLLDGEKITIDNEIPFGQTTLVDEEINEKYIRGEVRIVTEQGRYPLTAIKGMLDGDDYLLNPEFQRRHRWSYEQKSRLIESFIMNVPIPPIFLYEDKYSHYEVMDGLQRLTAIYEFYQNKYPLTGLELWSELNGKFYNTLPYQVQKGIDRRYLSAIIILKETAKDEFEALRLKQLVFERINSGGVKLAPQESRNAIYNGYFNEMCIKLSRNKYLCQMWNIPIPDKDELEKGILNEELIANDFFREMEDVEFVLRFFANRQRNELFNRANAKNLRDYLDFYLNKANKFPKETIHELASIFDSTVEFIYELLGEKAFYIYRERNGNWSWYNRATLVVYDPLMLVASEFYRQKDSILNHKSVVDEIFAEFYKKNYETFGGRNVNPGVINTRIELFRELFKSLAKK
ncbi:DUF262 domain-containing protein [Sediminibacterium goheungense]|uniref:Uncharacterized protein DUF262 n=1 Tax=Sediminibacterium goheungense TaxID=1086393 RepID=A0A4R6J0T8_9BACT|nr:DUF262 domain-containing protein [Sediminibacterium goheungense]TDO28417.1 uncharacterized protein DUF262 [Sediminibacterium goheungense]